MADTKRKQREEMVRVPPQNLEAEQALLGSILIDPDSVIKIIDALQPEDFYSDRHRLIYTCMVELFKQRDPVDVLTLANKLIERKWLDDIGGRTYLVEINKVVPTSSHIKQYADIVQKKATLRRLISAGNEMVRMGYEDAENDVMATLDDAQQKLFSISQSHNTQNFISINSVLDEAFDRIDKIHQQKGGLRGLPSGFTDLDKFLAGLQKSDLLILAARPSMGKTTLALDIARHVATKSKSAVAIFSLEMSKEQLVDKMLCAEASVDLWKMRTGRLSDRPEDDDFTKIGNAMGVLSESPIFIDDMGTANILDIRTKARRLQMDHNLGLIVVDYLQLMEGRGNTESRVQEISEISRGLKQIAKELDVPILALSQLNRSVELRQPAIPKLSDLRESGSIEQDADVVMFIYRESVYNRNLELDKKHIAQIIIAKHRNGPIGHINLFFDEQRVSFKNLNAIPGYIAPPQGVQAVAANPDTVLPSFNQSGE